MSLSPLSPGRAPVLDRSASPAFTSNLGVTLRLDRDGWWKASMRTTPNPGTYRSTTWTENLPPCTAAFRACDRDKQHVPSDQPDGAYALPGLYDIKDGLQQYLRKPKTYNFRSISRDAWGTHVVGHADKELNVSPGQYEVAAGRRELLGRSANFLSGTPRFPTPQEQTHIHTRHVASTTPPPTQYAPRSAFSTAATVDLMGTATMESRTPRFNAAKTSVGPKLGPGYYSKPTPVFPRVKYSRPPQASSPPAPAAPAPAAPSLSISE